ncbi:putative glycosyl transferase [Xylogone sp. PMI_703]|nr:putative glycosyl transferase [Xylogone sp. PMI_703]
MYVLRARFFFISISLLLLFYCRAALKPAYNLFSLPITWHAGSSDFYISPEKDGFDIAFENYSITQNTARPDFPNVIPPVLHQIMLGPNAISDSLQNTHNACLEFHLGWEIHLWTDENASRFVEEKYPHLKKMWDGYRYPIQRIDALRYMVLYEYGGAIIDMDLHCKRSLGPLRRFEFVAPAAHPVGFSNSMIMARKHHPFIEQLVSNLPEYDRSWFWLPYPTVMFSTGCHYVSTIHALQKHRADLRILSGTRENPRLHQLNGNAVTPLFHHLGASSWHSFDAALIIKIGRLRSSFVLLSTVLAILILVSWVKILRTRLYRRQKSFRSLVSKSRFQSTQFGVSDSGVALT